MAAGGAAVRRNPDDGVGIVGKNSIFSGALHVGDATIPWLSQDGTPNPNAAPLTLRTLVPVDRTWSGDRVGLVLPPAPLHWFDGVTGDWL